MVLYSANQAILYNIASDTNLTVVSFYRIMHIAILLYSLLETGG